MASAVKDPSAAPAKSSGRTLVSLALLLLVLAFCVYGIFERFRLLSDLAKEDAAKKTINDLGGTTMDADEKDWRVMFLPDQPDTAIRVGYVTLPLVGESPDHTQKVISILRDVPACTNLMLSRPEPPPSPPGSRRRMSGGTNPLAEGRTRNEGAGQAASEEKKAEEKKVDEEKKPDEDKKAEEKKSEEPPAAEEEKPAAEKKPEETPAPPAPPAEKSPNAVDIELVKKEFPHLDIKEIPYVPKGSKNGPMGS